MTRRLGVSEETIFKDLVEYCLVKGIEFCIDNPEAGYGN